MTRLPFSSAFLYYWRGIPPTSNLVSTTLAGFPCRGCGCSA